MLKNVGVWHRNFGKVELVELFSRISNNVLGAEIGIYNASFSTSLLRAISHLTLYMVDCYEEQPQETYFDTGNASQRIQDARYNLAKEIAQGFGDRAILVKKYSMDAVKDFEKDSLDFVYIDANHCYKNVTEDLVEWGKKVKPAGYISGHDYHDEFPGVKQAVLKYCGDNDIPSYQVGERDNVYLIWKGQR